MSTESSSAAIDSALDCNVANDALLGVESLSLSIALQVDKQFFDSLARLFGPSSLSKSPFFGLSTSSSTSFVFGEGDTSSVIENFIQILFGFFNKHSTDGLSGLVGVLEMNSKVESVSAASYKLDHV